MTQNSGCYRGSGLQGFVWTVYVLQLLAFFVGGLAFIASGVIAYIKHDESIGTLEESHFQWQIKTFWVGMIGAVAGVVLLIVWIGVIVLALTKLWIIYRSLKGAYYYCQGRETENSGFF